MAKEIVRRVWILRVGETWLRGKIQSGAALLLYGGALLCTFTALTEPHQIKGKTESGSQQ
jgi:hypothetical protein